MSELRAFHLEDDGLHLLDQRALPGEERWLVLKDVEDVASAIETLAVRGAPAIGGAAAMGMALAARAPSSTSGELLAVLEGAYERLKVTRPTAVNLFYALERVRERARALALEGASVEALRSGVLDEAWRVVREDEQACADMGRYGCELIDDGDVVLTVCHTGALATCGQGTALGVLKSAKAQGKRVSVIAVETRPLLQGARLTAWECLKVGLDVTLITDGMAAFALEKKGVIKAIAGADRIARNGDTANKIGTLGLARLCDAVGVPFFIAAPTSTIDVTLASGDEIPIEERHSDEVRRPRGAVFAPEGVPVWNPAFDVTPASLIHGIVTEKGVWRPPYDADALAGLGRER